MDSWTVHGGFDSRSSPFEEGAETYLARLGKHTSSTLPKQVCASIRGEGEANPLLKAGKAQRDRNELRQSCYQNLRA